MKNSERLAIKHYMVAGMLSVLATASSPAGLNLPYAPTTDTLHLWHFDGTAGSLESLDAVAENPITLTNEVQTQVPGSTVSLGAPAALPQLGTALRIVPTNYTAGNTFAFAVNRTAWPDTTPFRNAGSGAFTIEALVKIEANPSIVGNGIWEIVCGDSGQGTRAWQFRIQSGATPTLNFNNIAVGGNNLTMPLPVTGPNAIAVGQWYHVAASYNGDTPTNSDDPGVLTFYWTLLDANRTSADVLVVTNMTATLGGLPVIGVGGNARNNNGVANNEGFKGSIDEVRISAVALRSNQMAFTTGGTLNKPSFVQQPATNTLVGFGKTLSLQTLVSGTLPLTYRWQQDGGTGYTNVPAQSESGLLISNVTFAAGGSYRLIASNSVGMATSTVAHVSIGAAFSELFNTGVAADGTLPTGGVGIVDPHYTLVRSADPNNFGPNTMIWDMAAFPVLPSGVFTLVGGASQWIGPQANTYTSPQGEYVYRTSFVLDSVDLSQPVRLDGVWWENTTGSDILLNGHSTGLASMVTNFPNVAANFTITSGFVPGVNTLDFVAPCVNPNGSYPESAVRIELTGIGQALGPGLPVITNQPASRVVRESGKASFSVAALGRPPLSYQWYGDNVLLSDATNRVLTFDPAQTGAQGSSFRVVVRNDSGSVTSQVATLTLTTNRPPVAGIVNVFTAPNTPLNIPILSLLQAATDADQDPITFVDADGSSTNGGTITPDGINLVYTPVQDFSGIDQFNYRLSDSIEFSEGIVRIQVTTAVPPTFGIPVVSNGNLVFAGTGGAPGGTYVVLTSTNVADPLTSWTPVTTNTFDASGNFDVTEPMVTSGAQRFYILKVE